MFFVNNAIYGMTGGQMAPTTLVGQTSTTSPWGRRPRMKASRCTCPSCLARWKRRHISSGWRYLTTRTSCARGARCGRLSRSNVTTAGFAFVEILSPCPTIWNLSAVEARRWVAEKMIPVFPLNVFRDRKPPVSRRWASAKAGRASAGYRDLTGKNHAQCGIIELRN